MISHDGKDEEIARLRNALRVIAGEPVAREPGGRMFTYGSSLHDVGAIMNYASAALHEHSVTCWACEHGVPGCIHRPGAPR